MFVYYEGKRPIPLKPSIFIVHPLHLVKLNKPLRDALKKSCHSIVSLDFTSPLTDIQLNVLKEIVPNLTALTLRDTSRLTALGYQSLSQFAQLTILTLPNLTPRIDHVGLKTFQSITSLTLSQKCNGAELTIMGTITSLTELTVQCDDSVQNVSALHTLTNLKSLNLVFSKMNDSQLLALLKNLKKIESLIFPCLMPALSVQGLTDALKSVKDTLTLFTYQLSCSDPNKFQKERLAVAKLFE